MRRKQRTTRGRQPARRRAGVAAPLVTAILLGIALLFQAPLAVVHAQAHADHGPSVLEAAGAADHGYRPAGHEEDGPGDLGKGCEVCAAIAVGKLGWATPPGVMPAPISVGPGDDSRPHADPVVRGSVMIAGPRGPPIVG